MKTTSLILLTSACLILSAGAELVPGGDFQLYKPGEHTVTATLTTNAFAQWLASIPNPTDPTSLTVANGSAEYSDSTTGSKVDLLGWTKTQGGADILANGPGGSMALNLFAAWGGSPRPIVETIGSLHTIGAGDTITISTMVGGPTGGPKSGEFFFSLYAGEVEIVPSSVVNQSLPLNDGFQMISRTYDAATLAAHIGQSTKIRIAIPESNVAANRIIFDDVSIEGIGTGPTPPIRFIITPTAGSPGNYDFEWDSQEGKLYDLVSATDLSTASSTWPVWDGRENLIATPPINTLTGIPGGGDPRRFFVLIEKDAPPAPPLLAEDNVVVEVVVP